MRNYKFRGKRKDNNQWIYGSLVATFQAEICDESSISGFREEVDPDTVGQWTGFKDKHGTEIYEGDWLRVCVGYSSRVGYDEKQGCFLSYYSHPEDPEELLLCDLGNDVEVIQENEYQDWYLQGTH